MEGYTMNSQSKGYWIVTAKVTDQEGFMKEYAPVAGPIIGRHGGRVLARGEVFEVVEGEFAGRPFLIEFPTYAAALECFHSPGYQEAVALRQSSARFTIVIPEGVMMDAPVA
jgi:uncharacterized protein (DUF1330 family)